MLQTRPLIIAVAVSAVLSGQSWAYTETVTEGTTVSGELLNDSSAVQHVYGTAENTTIKGGDMARPAQRKWKAAGSMFMAYLTAWC